MCNQFAEERSAEEAKIHSMPKCEVVLISHGFQANYERGFANGLAATGLSVELISSDRTDYSGLASGIRTRNLRGSQRVDRPYFLKTLGLMRYHLSLLEAVGVRSHITHVFGLLSPVWIVGVLEGAILRLLSRRYVLTVHNLLPHDRHTRQMHIAHWLSYRLPHRLVVHTARMREELIRQFHIEPKRVVVMEHGIEPRSDGAQDIQTETSNAEGLRILFFGIVAPYKGVDLLLKATRSLSVACSINIVGESRDAKLCAEINALIADHPRAAFITWQNNYVPEAVVPELFNRSDVIVLPYRHIDQSGVLFQAFRFGLPVVATRVGAFEDYVTPEVGELAEPGDVSSLRSAIERFVARRSRVSRGRIIEIGRTYEWPKTVRALKEAYD